MIGCNLINNELGVMYCKICKESGGKCVFARSRSINFKVPTLQEHANTGEHKRLSWAILSGSSMGGTLHYTLCEHMH